MAERLKKWDQGENFLFTSYVKPSKVHLEKPILRVSAQWRSGVSWSQFKFQRLASLKKSFALLSFVSFICKMKCEITEST